MVGCKMVRVHAEQNETVVIMGTINNTPSEVLQFRKTQLPPMAVRYNYSEMGEGMLLCST